MDRNGTRKADETPKAPAGRTRRTYLWLTWVLVPLPVAAGMFFARHLGYDDAAFLTLFLVMSVFLPVFFIRVHRRRLGTYERMSTDDRERTRAELKDFEYDQVASDRRHRGALRVIAVVLVVGMLDGAAIAAIAFGNTMLAIILVAGFVLTVTVGCILSEIKPRCSRCGEKMSKVRVRPPSPPMGLFEEVTIKGPPRRGEKNRAGDGSRSRRVDWIYLCRRCKLFYFAHADFTCGEDGPEAATQ